MDIKASLSPCRLASDATFIQPARACMWMRNLSPVTVFQAGQAPHLGMSLSVVSLFPRRNVKFNIICSRVDGYALLYKATKVLCQITKKMGKELS